MRVLSCIEEAGLCCCMEPARIMRFLLKPISTQTPLVRSYTLGALARALLEFCCGGADAAQKRAAASCNFCRDETAADLASSAHWGSDGALGSGVDKSDSALSSSDASLHGDAPTVNPKWRCLQRYLSLMTTTSEEVSTQVTQHVLSLVSQGSDTFKQELFYSVFLPIMKVITEQYSGSPSGLLTDSAESGYLSEPVLQQPTESPGFTTSGSLTGESELGKQTAVNKPADSRAAKPAESAGGTAPASTDAEGGRISETVVHHCLSALPLILKSKASQDLFLNCGGLRQLCRLVQTPALRRCVLRVFQVIIMLEDRRALLDGSKRTSLGSLEQNNTDSADSETGAALLPGTSSYSHSAVIDAFMRLLLLNPELEAITRAHSRLDVQRVDYHKGQATHRADSSGSDSTTVSEPRLNPFEESVSTLTESVAEKMINPETDLEKTDHLDASFDKAQLTTLCDMWTSCAALLPYSHSFQLSFGAAGGPRVAYDLLMFCVRRILRMHRQLDTVDSVRVFKYPPLDTKHSATTKVSPIGPVSHATQVRPVSQSPVGQQSGEKADNADALHENSEDAATELKNWFLLLEASLVVCLTSSKLQHANQVTCFVLLLYFLQLYQ